MYGFEEKRTAVTEEKSTVVATPDSQSPRPEPRHSGQLVAAGQRKIVDGKIHSLWDRRRSWSARVMADVRVVFVFVYV